MKLGSFGLVTIAHAFLALLLIIELGIIGYLVDRLDDAWWSESPSYFNFMLFNCIWSIIVLLYIALTPVVLPKLFFSVASLGLLALTSLFWFAGSIATAVRVSDCDGNGICRTSEAGVAFGFFLWAGFTALAVLEGLAYWRGRGHGAHADTRSKASTYPGA